MGVPVLEFWKLRVLDFSVISWGPSPVRTHAWNEDTAGMFPTGQALQMHWDKSLWQKQKGLCLLPAGQSGWCRWGIGALPQRGWCTSSCESCCGRSAAHGRSRRWRCRSGGRPVKAGCQPTWWSPGAGRGLHHCAESKTNKSHQLHDAWLLMHPRHRVRLSVPQGTKKIKWI